MMDFGVRLSEEQMVFRERERSGLPNKGEDEQFKYLPNPACWISLTSQPVSDQKLESYKRLAGYVIQFSGQLLEQVKRAFGLPVWITAWPVSRQNQGFKNSAFQIEEPVVRLCGRTKQIITGLSDLENRLSDFEAERRFSKSDFSD